MILLIFYISTVYCSVVQSILYSSAQLLRLRSFGFEEGGTFSINITTPNVSNLIIFLIAEKGSFINPNTEMGLYSVCDENPPFISELNSSFHRSVKTVFWDGVIKKRNVYYPYAVNCNKNSTIYKIITDFRNPKSHLDFRDNNYSIIYTFISFIYVIITFVWIINAFLHPKFWIELHAGLSFVSSTKAILCALESKMWESRRQGFIGYNECGSLYSFFLVLHYTSFLSVPIMAMAGWCIFRDHVPFSEISRILFSNISLVYGLWPTRYSTSIKTIAFSVMLLSVGSIAFLRIVSDYIIILNHLGESISNEQVVLKRKVSLITKFTSSFLIFGFGYLIAYILSFSFNFWNILSDTIIELGYAVLTFIELYFFLIRKSYEGKEGEEGEDIRKEDTEYNNSIYYLMEPTIHDIALISIQK